VEAILERSKPARLDQEDAPEAAAVKLVPAPQQTSKLLFAFVFIQE
jgi:hypothetical protein